MPHLILKRAVGQTVVLYPPHGDPITVTVTEVRKGLCGPGSAFLKFSLESNVKVLRGELVGREPKPDPESTKEPVSCTN